MAIAGTSISICVAKSNPASEAPKLKRARLAFTEINVKSVSMKTLIKNAQVVLPAGTIQTSVLISGNKIQAIDPPVQTSADVTIDATGKFLLPGVIDDQVHFREPGLTHKEDLAHASRACAKGGVTSFLEMPNTIPNAINQQLLDAKLDLAAKSSLVNYGFYIGATTSNLAELKNGNAHARHQNLHWFQHR